MNNRNKSVAAKDLYWSKSQESIFTKSSSQLCVRRSRAINQIEQGRESGTASAAEGLTLGVSIVQGSDNNVYVKDLVKNGPGARAGLQIGDQVGRRVRYGLLRAIAKYLMSFNLIADTVGEWCVATEPAV